MLPSSKRAFFIKLPLLFVKKHKITQVQTLNMLYYQAQTCLFFYKTTSERAQDNTERAMIRGSKCVFCPEHPLLPLKVHHIALNSVSVRV